MMDIKFIRNKIRLISEYNKQLDIICDVSAAELKKDFIRYYASERVFQLIVDEITDINTHVIKYSNFLEAPNDFQSTFIILAENEVMPEDFAKRVAPTVGLRNRLVHRYEKVDKDLFIKMIKKEKDDFKKYIKYIEEYIRK